MRKSKKIAGLALAAVTAQSTIFSGNMMIHAEETGIVSDAIMSEAITTSQAVVVNGVTDVMVNPSEEPSVTPEAVTVPAVTPIKDDAEGNTEFIFTSGEIEVSEGVAAGFEITGTSLTITESGTYYLSGECTDGAITVAKKTKDVTLVFNGLSLTSQTTAPVVMNSKTEVNVVVYGENVLADTGKNNDETYPDNEEAENAVLKAKSGSTLTVSGGGKLLVDSNAKNAIKSNGSLIIEDVVMDIESVDNGISNEDNVVINGGYLHIQSEGDGIKSGADDEPEGSITVNDGTIVIDAMADGMQATKEIVVNDGVLDIRTYGGADAEYDGDDDSYPSAKGIKASGSYDVVVNEETGETTEVDATGCSITINGGTCYLDCADDAIHSDGDVTITGGYFKIASGDDAVHSDYINTIGTEGGSEDDLYLYVTSCVEGIEGSKVFMHAGTTRVFAADDGVNAANSDLRNYDYMIKVTGGNHYISCSEGDGFDSNGTLLFEGGNTAVLGSSGAGEGDPLDCDMGMKITGGRVLAIGTYSPMGATPSNNTNYVEFGGNSGMNPGGMNPGGMNPGMPEVSPGGANPGGMNPGGMNPGGMNPGMPEVSPGGANPGGMNPGMPEVSPGGANPGGMNPGGMNPGGMNPGMPEVSPGGATPGGMNPGMPEVSPGGANPGGMNPGMPGAIQSNITIQDKDTVVVCDASGKAVASTVAGWLPDASSYRAGYVFCWSEEIRQDKDYMLYVNGEKMADTKEELLPDVPENPDQDQQTFQPGDVNKDGKITLDDAQKALRMALLLDSVEVGYADMDGDGKVTLGDAQKILRKALLLD